MNTAELWDAIERLSVIRARSTSSVFPPRIKRKDSSGSRLLTVHFMSQLKVQIHLLFLLFCSLFKTLTAEYSQSSHWNSSFSVHLSHVSVECDNVKKGEMHLRSRSHTPRMFLVRDAHDYETVSAHVAVAHVLYAAVDGSGVRVI